MKHKNLIIALAVIVLFGLFIWVASRFGDHATLAYPGGELDVLVADNAMEHTKGLSGTHEDSLGADGMLFIFNDHEERVFWMNGMEYDLDVIWIVNGKIVKVDSNVPAPEPGEEPERMYSRPFEVDMVLELPAGSAYKYGLLAGQELRFEK